MAIKSVMVTGATGFVGRSVVRALLSRGMKPVCLVRSEDRLRLQHHQVDPSQLDAVVGGLGDKQTLAQAADGCEAVVHLVGVIIQRWLHGQTFHRIHVEGTCGVIEATRQAGVKRYVHMSALGSRADAASMYHKTKWEAEKAVRASDLDWTIFRPSLIHGPQGEFMTLMNRLICGVFPPVIPYFGNGRARIQPVSVEDVAHCIAESVSRDNTVGKVIDLGGPRTYSWTELYNTCRALMPGARHWKPLMSQPVALAKVIAALSGPPMALTEAVSPRLGLYRFDRGQVQMSQEDNVCDHTIAEELFGLRMRSFEDELSRYAESIR
ncbi:MAG: complex I NDUFA9 subunit family protein [Phycisphaerales bacterium]|nr:MAG: complex I NDUFA9 subunit family protein [Phycisphaerales bacterium]